LLTNVMAAGSVDLVHAHGTGTQFNDPIELSAIESSLPAGKPPTIIYSHKSALGHSLGASGLVSVVVNCLCHVTGRVPGNVNTCDALATTEQMILPQQAVHRPMRRSLACAAGFGGPIAVLSLVSS
jgi:3-oxoacyl-(acyl-carrier-protein) synthase